MALIFTDGCDSYSADTDIIEKWDVVDVSELNYSGSTGRFGGGAINFIDDAFDLRKSFPVVGTTVTTDELFVSFSFKVTTMQTQEIFIANGPNDGNQMSLRMKADGTLDVWRGFVTTKLGATDAGTIKPNRWYRIELRLVLDNTTGVIELKVDGEQLINLTAQDTQTDADPGCTTALWGGPNGGNWYYDDFVIHSSAGDEPTGFIGDLEIVTQRPDGVGSSSDSTASGAATRHEAVDDAGSNDGDTTHVAMAAALDEDLYTCGDLGKTANTVHAVAVNLMARADSSSPRAIRAKVKENVTEGNGSTENVANGADYHLIQGFFPENPDTTAAWTSSEVDAMEIGQEVIT